MRVLFAVPTLVLAALAVTACSQKRPMAPTPTTDSLSHSAADSANVAESMRPHAHDRDARMRAERERRMAELRNTLSAPIHFGFDRSDLTPAARSGLDAKLTILQQNPEMQIRIGGHTDELGSDEYNLALGQRRAAVAKRYLTDRGIAESRIETASFGEERPAAMQSDEAARSQNRRDEFEITAGEIALLP